jgi:hypothetical protein
MDHCGPFSCTIQTFAYSACCPTEGVSQGGLGGVELSAGEDCKKGLMVWTNIEDNGQTSIICGGALVGGGVDVIACVLPRHSKFKQASRKIGS